jgi:DNA polymerase-1
MTTALLDADIIAFRAAAKAQDRFDGELVADPKVAIREAENIVQQWIKYVKPNTTFMCFSCPTRVYFRHDIYPEYKGNRKGLERPPALSAVIEYLKDKYKVIMFEGLEADDVMGICSGDPRFENPVMVSIDKDMMTVPGKYLNPDKMRRPVRNNMGLADTMMYKQALTGDSTDNYKGIPGIGPKKADNILNSGRVNSMWHTCEEAFVESGLTVEYGITMVQLARILRFEDYNPETGEVRLWHPNKEVWHKPSSLSTTEKTESKSSTSLKQSSKTSQEKKPSTLETSSDTSVDTETKKTEPSPPPILKNQGGISKGSSLAVKQKRKATTKKQKEKSSD